MEKQLMSHSCITLRTSICIVFAFGLSAGHSQSFDSQGFFRHLKTEGLLLEQVALSTYLLNDRNTTPEAKDSFLLDLSASYFKLKMPDSCRSTLGRISGKPVFSERKEQLYITSLILTGRYREAAEKSEMLSLPAFRMDVQTSLAILNGERFAADTSVKEISPFAGDLLSRYLTTPRHSPLAAGVFSAVLPGSGKWYIGYKRQAVTAFIANVMLGAQAYESYAKAGATSPQFIVTAGLFGIFYAGNIWGSVQAAKKKKRDHINELKYEILDHYHTELSKLSG